MRTLVVILSSCCLAAMAYPFEEIIVEDVDSEVTGNLTLDNGLEFGKWGPVQFCRTGSYARDIEALFESYTLTATDETAINALKLYCMVPEGHHTGQISSTIGERGEWQGMKSCQEGIITGMRAQVLAYQGSFTDDVAVQNVEMECNYGESTLLAVDDDANIKAGNWSSWSTCDFSSAICGIEVRYEQPFLIQDTVGISDIIMYCCEIENPPPTTPSPTGETSSTRPFTVTSEGPVSHTSERPHSETTTGWPEPESTTGWPEPESTTGWPEPETTTRWPEPESTTGFSEPESSSFF